VNTTDVSGPSTGAVVFVNPRRVATAARCTRPGLTLPGAERG
jgi:hypothetical protein